MNWFESCPVIPTKMRAEKQRGERLPFSAFIFPSALAPFPALNCRVFAGLFRICLFPFFSLNLVACLRGGWIVRWFKKFPKFVIMQVQLNIEFYQLLKIVKDLPLGKLKQLKAEIERMAADTGSGIDLERLLLNGPTATKKQLATIAKNRKAINQWRTKQ